MGGKNDDNDQNGDSEPGQDASRQAPEPPPVDTGGKKDWH